jgi:hypothetical protein
MPLTWSIHKAFPVDRLGEARDAPIPIRHAVMVFKWSGHDGFHADDASLNLSPAKKDTFCLTRSHH